ncbi:MAG TPA: hypothetical protein VK420_12895 [Longimicrobium sp.]|nr:hypothetical protein [Longimicrobium sp.]
MSRVVARCPNCGVEHDDATAGPCEVCGTTLRFWCRLHGAETGWLDTPECPRCAAEAAERRSRPAPPRPPARPRRERAPVERPYAAPAPGRDPRVVLREGADDLRPYVVAGAGAAGRMIRAVLAVIRNVIVFGVLGGIVGGFVAYNQRGDLVWPLISGALIGAAVGLFFGVIGALRILFAGGGRRVR